MRFNHTVKYGGVYYKAGEEVPMEQEKKPSAPSLSEEFPKETTKRRGRQPKQVRED